MSPETVASQVAEHGPHVIGAGSVDGEAGYIKPGAGCGRQVRSRSTVEIGSMAVEIFLRTDQDSTICDRGRGADGLLEIRS